MKHYKSGTIYKAKASFFSKPTYRFWLNVGGRCIEYKDANGSYEIDFEYLEEEDILLFIDTARIKEGQFPLNEAVAVEIITKIQQTMSHFRRKLTVDRRSK